MGLWSSLGCVLSLSSLKMSPFLWHFPPLSVCFHFCRSRTQVICGCLSRADHVLRHTHNSPRPSRHPEQQFADGPALLLGRFCAGRVFTTVSFITGVQCDSKGQGRSLSFAVESHPGWTGRLRNTGWRAYPFAQRDPHALGDQCLSKSLETLILGCEIRRDFHFLLFISPDYLNFFLLQTRLPL